MVCVKCIDIKTDRLDGLNGSMVGCCWFVDWFDCFAVILGYG